MSTIILVMYSSAITFLRTRVQVLKKYSYKYTSTITPSLICIPFFYSDWVRVMELHAMVTELRLFLK